MTTITPEGFNLTDLWKNTVKQLRIFARENKINLKGKYLKADIIEIIQQWVDKIEQVVTEDGPSREDGVSWGPVQLEHLPSELIREIILANTVGEMVNLCSANKPLTELCEPLWMDKYRQLYAKEKVDSDMTWKENLLGMSVFGFGWNKSGQLGYTIDESIVEMILDFTGASGHTWDENPIPQKVLFKGQRLVKITQISCGSSHTVCLDDSGGVWTFGRNDDGQLGLGDRINKDTPHKINPRFFRVNRQLLKIIQVSAGSDHTVCLDEKGNVWTFGGNKQGQLGLGSPKTTHKRRPHRIPDFQKITRIFAGNFHTICIDEDGNVWTFGGNLFGELGSASPRAEYIFSPRMVPYIPRMVQASGSQLHTILLDENGKVWVSGSNSDGQLGLDIDRTNVYKQIPDSILPVKIIQVSARAFSSMVLDEFNRVWGFGDNISGQLGLGSTEPGILQNNVRKPTIIPTLSNIIQISVGRHHSVFLDNNYRVWTAGSNDNGQIGDSSTFNVDTTPEIRIPQKAVQVSAGGRYTMFIGM